MKQIFSLFLLVIMAFCCLLCSKNKKDSVATPPPAPELTDIAPKSGIIGDPVKLTGKNLAKANSVHFGSIASTVIEVNGASLTTVVPAGIQPGVVKITVTNDGGSSNSLNFEIIDAPEHIDSFPPQLIKTVPDKNYTEYPLLIYGNYLSGVTEITFNDKPAPVFTNNKKVLTTVVPKDLPAGIVKIKIKTVRGTATLDFTVKGPSPTGPAGVNFSIVNIPPPGYVPPISNQWSCGFFAVDTDSTFHDIVKINDSTGEFYVTGKYEYTFDTTADYNALNYIEFTNKQEEVTFAGHFSYNKEDPCIVKMVLISSTDGTITECTFNKRLNGSDPACQ